MVYFNREVIKMKNSKKFIALLESGKIKKNILPNSALDYTKYQEQKDFSLFCNFVNSFALDEIINCEVSKYNGDEQI